MPGALKPSCCSEPPRRGSSCSKPSASFQPPLSRARSPQPSSPAISDLWQDDFLQLLLSEVLHVGLQVRQQHQPHVLLVHLKQLQQHRDHPRLEQGRRQQARGVSPCAVYPRSEVITDEKANCHFHERSTKGNS